MFNKNPTMIINGLAELIKQILPLLVIVGLVHLSPEKLAGWISIIGISLYFISTTILKSQVTPNDAAEAQLKAGVKAGINAPNTASVHDVMQTVKEQNATN